jgi:TonB family protein
VNDEALASVKASWQRDRQRKLDDREALSSRGGARRSRSVELGPELAEARLAMNNTNHTLRSVEHRDRVRSSKSLVHLRVSCRALLIACTALALPALASAQSDLPVEQRELVAPALTESVEPVYPESKRESGETAKVVLRLTLDETGKVTEATVLESAGPEFDAAALEAAPKLVFQPATKGGKAVPARIAFRFDFQLQSQLPNEPAAAATPALEKPVARPKAQTAASAAESTPSVDIDVEGERPPREPTKQVLSAEEISKIPGTNGDALRALTNLPGVARPPGLEGMLIVRGSGPRDTQVFVDGITIPTAYHFGGLSSVIPSEMLEKIDFYPGNFSPEFGRAMGGVVNIGVRSPRKDRLGGLLQFDLIDGRVLAEAPLGDSTRFMIGARRSWVDAWLGPAMREAGVGVSVAPVYYDYQAMVEQDLGSKTKLRLFAYGSDDRMELNLKSPDSGDPAAGGDTKLHTAFLRVQARAETRISDDLRWTTSVAVGKDREAFAQGPIDVDTDVFVVEGRTDLRLRLGKEVTAVAGFDTQWVSYDVAWRYPPIDFDDGDSSGPLFGRPVTEVDASGSVTRPGAFALLELEPIEHLKLFPGVRADYTQDTGNFTADPRIGARYDLAPGFPRTTLKGGVGVFHQPPEPYESIEPVGTPGVESSRAMHYSVGIEQEFSRPLEISVEGFYKDLDKLVVGVPAADSASGGFDYENIGSGRTYGTEFLLRYKPQNRFFGWVAYTLSRSERRDSADSAEYRFEHDQTHILTALGSYKLGRGWQAGARFRYVTGSPYTPYVGGMMDYDSGSYSAVESSKTNSKRLPAFHQLDVRVDKTWTFQSWKLSAYLDLQNAYNRQNTEEISYNYNYSKTGTIAGLPILPVIGIRGEL